MRKRTMRKRTKRKTMATNKIWLRIKPHKLNHLQYRHYILLLLLHHHHPHLLSNRPFRPHYLLLH
jgi:hypothetical protein